MEINKDKKTLCIFTYERTGSGWLCQAFNAEQSISVHELYSEDPTIFLLNTYKIYKEIYKIDPVLLSLIYKIYDSNNFFIDNNVNKIIKQNMLAKNLYSLDTMLHLKSICTSNGYNFIFKIFPQHLQSNKIDIKDILSKVDYVLINYRKNILKSFISLSMANASGEWYSKQKRIDKITKIVWDENAYIRYYNSIRNKIYSLLDIQNQHSKAISICYEELHENPELTTHDHKISYLQNIIDKNSINMPINNLSFFDKQNNRPTIEEYSEFFINPTEFLTSVKHIPIIYG